MMGLGFYGQYTTIKKKNKKLGTSPTRSEEVADQGVRMLCTNVTQIFSHFCVEPGDEKT